MPPEVEIEYCASCGYLQDALRVAEAILARDALRLSGLRFRIGAGGVFRVWVDGALVWDGRSDPWDPSFVSGRVAKQLEEP